LSLSLAYPVTAHLYPTFKCNLNCKHCAYDCKPTSKSMSFDNIKIVVDKLQTLKILNININGGEPLLHPQFDNIVRLINNKNFGWGLFTNGTLITSNKAKIIAENEPYSIAISLHGGDEETHNWLTGGGYKQAIEGIKNLRKYYDGEIKINSLIHPKRNKEEFLKIINFCEEYDLKLDVYGRFIPMGRAWKNWSMLNKKPNFDYKDLIPTNLLSSKKRNLRLVIKRILLDILPNRGHVCDAGSAELYIDPEGFVYGCFTFMNAGEPRKKGGNILYEDPIKLWKYDPFLNETRNLHPLGCFYRYQCPFWKDNKCPHCFGISLNLFNSYAYPHPFCFEYIKDNIDPDFSPLGDGSDNNE